MLDAIGRFFESLIELIASVPDAITRGISSFDLGSLNRLADLNWLVFAGIVILVVLLTYRDRKNY